MNKKPHILLVGCGNWGKNILRDLKSLGCEVTVVSKSVQSQQNAKNGQADAIASKISEVNKIDGAVVASTTISHYEVINEIITIHGLIPIFSEKPLCVNTEEAFELFQKSPNNLFVMDKWRYHQGILELAKLAKEEVLGKVTGIKLNRNSWGIPHTDVSCVWILLPHDLSITLEILGYIPEPKFARFDKTNAGIQGMTGWLEDENHWVSFELSERYVGYKREIIVYFENGIAQLTDSYNNNIELYKTEKTNLKEKAVPQLIPFENVMPLYKELETFVNYINGVGSAPKSSALEGYNTVKIIQQLIDLAHK